MKRRTGKQLLACLLALAMFATNVDAVCAAPAVTAGGNAEVQSATEGVQYTVGADGRVTMTPAGGETSGTINRVPADDPAETSGQDQVTAPADDPDEEEPAEDVAEPEDPAEDEDGLPADEEETPAEEDEEMTETTVPDETTGTDGDEDAAELPVFASSEAPERVGDPGVVTVVANSGRAGLNEAYKERLGKDDGVPEGATYTPNGREENENGNLVWEWSTVGMGQGSALLGGIVVTIYEAARGDNHESPALGYVENWGDDWPESVVDRERIYTDSFTKVAELIRNYELSGYLDGYMQGSNNKITPDSGKEFAYRISLDAERHILDEQEEDRDPSHFHVDVEDINAVSANNSTLYNGFAASTKVSEEYDLFNKIACIDLNGNELDVHGNGQWLLISLPILSTDCPLWDHDDDSNSPDVERFTWYGLDNVPYHSTGSLYIDPQNESQIQIDAAVRVMSVSIRTDNALSATPVTKISRSTVLNKTGTFECRDFEYHGMELRVTGVRFQAGASETEYGENGEPVNDTGSHVYLGATDDIYAREIIPEMTGAYEITHAASVPTEAKIYFREGTIDGNKTVANLFGNVNIAPRVNIYADGLQLGHVNVRTEAYDDLNQKEVETGALNKDRLPQILLTHAHYASNPMRTLHVYGYVNSDWQHNIPLLRVGLDQDKNDVADTPLSADGTVVFFDDLTKEEADNAGAHIRVDQRLDEDGEPMVDEEDNPIYNNTDNSPVTYVVAGNANLLWRRNKDDSGNPESGMILADPASMPLRLEYIEGGSVDRSGDTTAGGDGFVWLDAQGDDASAKKKTEYFYTLEEISDFLNSIPDDIAAVLWVQQDAAAGGRGLDLSWEKWEEDPDTHEWEMTGMIGVTTLYIMDGDGDPAKNPELDLGGYSVYSSGGRSNTVVFLDDDVCYANGRFDLMGYGDWLFIGENSVTGDTWNSCFFDITDLCVPQGTIRLGDTALSADEEVKDLESGMGNGIRLEAARILVHGGMWRVSEVQLRAGSLKNAKNTDVSRFPEYDDGLPLSTGGAGTLVIARYSTGSGEEAVQSQYSDLYVSQNINVNRNVQIDREQITKDTPGYGALERDYYHVADFHYDIPKVDENGNPVLQKDDQLNQPYEYTTEREPQGRIIVGGGALLNVEGAINGGQHYLTQPAIVEYDDQWYFADWNGDPVWDEGSRNNVKWVNMTNAQGNPIVSPEYAHAVLISDGLVKLYGNADIYGLTLAKNSRTCVYDNLNMEAEEEIRLVGEEEKPIRYTTPAAGSFTYMEKGAAVYLAPGYHGAHEDHYLNINNLAMLGADGEVTLYVPVSIDENEDHYTALTIRGDVPAGYSAGKMATLYGKYLPTLAMAAEGDARLAIGMYSAGSVNDAGEFTGTLTDIPTGLDVLHTGETIWDEDRIGSVCILDEDGNVVEDLVPRYEYWDGTNEEGEPEGQPDGHLEYDYGYHVYRVKVEVDDETNPTRIDEFYGNDEEGDAFRSGSYVGSYATWAEAVTAVEEDAENRGESFIPHWEYDPDQDRDVIVMDGDAEYPAYAIRLLNGVAMDTGSNAMPELPSRLIVEGFRGGDVIRIDGEVMLKTPTEFHAVCLDAAKAGIHVGEDGWLQFAVQRCHRQAPGDQRQQIPSIRYG